ncbi:MAG: hypothetical protein ACTHW1_03125 [Ancrocorticia sp.]|uniref:hypothetical protein n=1 Tax=Ancrocorticia sp. TaxID=2593684 RepID=UPI003F91CD07
MRLLQGVLGAIGGLLVGALAAVTYAGPLGMPILGLLVATVLVAAGAWFLLAWGKRAAWLGYAIGIIAVTFWLFMAPPATDTIMSVYRWASDAWFVLAPASALIPGFIVRDSVVDR